MLGYSNGSANVSPCQISIYFDQGNDLGKKEQCHFERLDSTPSASSATTTLNTICAPSFDQCDESTIRGMLANFYTACSTDMLGTNGDGSNGNKNVIDIYDVLYLINPLKNAICTKSGNQYCVDVISLQDSSNGSSSSTAAADSGNNNGNNNGNGNGNNNSTPRLVRLITLPLHLKADRALHRPRQLPLPAALIPPLRLPALRLVLRPHLRHRTPIDLPHTLPPHSTRATTMYSPETKTRSARLPPKRHNTTQLAYRTYSSLPT